MTSKKRGVLAQKNGVSSHLGCLLFEGSSHIVERLHQSSSIPRTNSYVATGSKSESFLELKGW